MKAKQLTTEQRLGQEINQEENLELLELNANGNTTYPNL